MKNVIRSSVSLCERCKHRDWHKESDLRETWAQAGLEPFEHVWCSAQDGPCDMRWETCTAFERM